MCVCAMHMCAYMYVHAYVEISKQLWGVCSLLLPCGSRVSLVSAMLLL